MKLESKDYNFHENIFWNCYLQNCPFVPASMCYVENGFVIGGTVAPDNKVHGANMGPTWVLLAPELCYLGPLFNIKILCYQCVYLHTRDNTITTYPNITPYSSHSYALPPCIPRPTYNVISSQLLGSWNCIQGHSMAELCADNSIPCCLLISGTSFIYIV